MFAHLLQVLETIDEMPNLQPLRGPSTPTASTEGASPPVVVLPPGMAAAFAGNGNGSSGNGFVSEEALVLAASEKEVKASMQSHFD